MLLTLGFFPLFFLGSFLGSVHFCHLMENNCSRFILSVACILYISADIIVIIIAKYPSPVRAACMYIVQCESVSVYDNRRKISVKKRRFVCIHLTHCESASGVLCYALFSAVWWFCFYFCYCSRWNNFYCECAESRARTHTYVCL